MGLFDSIKSSLGGVLGSAVAPALPGILDQVYPGGMSGMLGQLQQNGYASQVQSWLGHGPNQPITAEDLKGVLGEEHVQAIVRRLGIPADQVLEAVAKALPAAVDQHSPDGQLQTPAANDPAPSA